MFLCVFVIVVFRSLKMSGVCLKVCILASCLTLKLIRLLECSWNHEYFGSLAK